MSSNIDQMISRMRLKALESKDYLVNLSFLYRAKYLFNKISVLKNLRQKLKAKDDQLNITNHNLHTAERIACEVEFNFLKHRFEYELAKLRDLIIADQQKPLGQKIINLKAQLTRLSKKRF